MSISSLTPLLTHDARVRIYPHLTALDLVHMTRVCKDWYEALLSEKCQYLWDEPLKRCDIEIVDITPYQTWCELANSCSTIVKTTKSILDQKVYTALELDCMGYECLDAMGWVHASKQQAYNKAITQKFKQSHELTKGLDAAIQLYYVNILDFSLVQKYATKLETCCGNDEIDLRLSRVVYKKEGTIDFALSTLEKAQLRHKKFSTISNIDFQYKALQVVVNIYLKKSNLEQALKEIKNIHEKRQLATYTLIQVLRTFIDYAYDHKRLDLVEQLLTLTKGDDEIDEWAIWMGQLKEAKAKNSDKSS